MVKVSPAREPARRAAVLDPSNSIPARIAVVKQSVAAGADRLGPALRPSAAPSRPASSGPRSLASRTRPQNAADLVRPLGPRRPGQKETQGRRPGGVRDLEPARLCAFGGRPGKSPEPPTCRNIRNAGQRTGPLASLDRGGLGVARPPPYPPSSHIPQQRPPHSAPPRIPSETGDHRSQAILRTRGFAQAACLADSRRRAFQ